MLNSNSGSEKTYFTYSNMEFKKLLSFFELSAINLYFIKFVNFQNTELILQFYSISSKDTKYEQRFKNQKF